MYPERFAENKEIVIKEIIEDLKDAFDKKLLINSLENEKYFNIKRMQSINLA